MSVTTVNRLPVISGIFNYIGIILWTIFQFLSFIGIHILKLITQIIVGIIPIIYLIALYVFFTIFLLYIIGLIIQRNLIGEALGFSSSSSSNRSSNIRSDGSNIDPYAFNINNDEEDSGWFGDMFKMGSTSTNSNLKIDREELNVGRCDDMENITSSDNKNCNNINPQKDIVWKMNSAMNPDYMLLPPEMRNKDQVEISIPFKKVEGFYTPDCEGSYYTKTGEKTGLLKNDRKLGSCKIVRKNAENYGSI